MTRHQQHVSTFVLAAMLALKVVPAVPGGHFRASGCAGGRPGSSCGVVPGKFQTGRSSSMMVTGTSFSLFLEGGSSTVSGSVMLWIMLRHSWNYFQRHRYHQQGRRHNLFPGAVRPRRSTEELLAPRLRDARGKDCRQCQGLPELRLRPPAHSGPRAGVLSVADEANDAASDKCSTRQRQARCTALQRVRHSRRHLNRPPECRGASTTAITARKAAHV